MSRGAQRVRPGKDWGNMIRQEKPSAHRGDDPKLKSMEVEEWDRRLSR